MTWTRVVGTAVAALAALLAGCAPRVTSGAPGASPWRGDDVVYLKDGRTLRGSIVEQVPDSSLSLRTGDGVVLVLQQAQIRRVRARSALRPGATWVPSLRLPDSALLGRWVHIEAKGSGTHENRVVRIDGEMVAVRRGGWLGSWFGAEKIPRASITDALVSTSRSRKTGAYAITMGLGEGVLMYLSARGMEASTSEAMEAAAIGAGFGALVGALIGHFTVEHEGWRRLELSPTATASPTSSNAVAATVRLRL